MSNRDLRRAKFDELFNIYEDEIKRLVNLNENS